MFDIYKDFFCLKLVIRKFGRFHKIMRLTIGKLLKKYAKYGNIMGIMGIMGICQIGPFPHTQQKLTKTSLRCDIIY